MKLGTGLGLLALGVAGLGFWANFHHAKTIEAQVSAASTVILAPSVHGATAQVMGRDINVMGIIDGPDERDALLASLGAVPGRRVVHMDQAQVLEKVSPFSATLSRAEGGAVTATGHIATEKMRADLAAITGGEAVAGLSMAAGAPAEFTALAMSGATALQAMVAGEAQISDAAMTLTGTVLGPDQAAAVEAALAGLAPGAASTGIKMLDDGTPAAYELTYSATDGAILNGKLPKGSDGPGIAGALGLSAVGGTAKTALLGDAGDLAGFGVFQSLLPLVETLKLQVSPEERRLDIGVQGGIDPAALTAKLQADLPDHQISVATVTSDGENGAQRVNASTGTPERLMGGYWVGVPEVKIGLAGCQAAVDGYLIGTTIKFQSGSDALDSSAIAVINGLAGIMARCVEEGALTAKIGGHTDNSGDPTANLGLSQRRATAVRRELIARGVPGQALSAVGFGDTLPVADNATDAGKALNRRTSIEWTE
jgi:OOP family OmpA-OmpF porin